MYPGDFGIERLVRILLNLLLMNSCIVIVHTQLSSLYLSVPRFFLYFGNYQDYFCLNFKFSKYNIFFFSQEHFPKGSITMTLKDDVESLVIQNLNPETWNKQEVCALE